MMSMAERDVSSCGAKYCDNGVKTNEYCTDID